MPGQAFVIDWAEGRTHGDVDVGEKRYVRHLASISSLVTPGMSWLRAQVQQGQSVLVVEPFLAIVVGNV